MVTGSIHGGWSIWEHGHLQKVGALSADWAALLDAIGGKAEGLKASRPVA
jgi:hypothetical protein